MATISQQDRNHAQASGLAPTTVTLACLGCGKPTLLTFHFETSKGNSKLEIAQVTQRCRCRITLQDAAEMLRLAGEGERP